MKNKLIITLVVTAFLFSSCEVLKELKTFAKCDFKMGKLVNPNLAGVSIKDKKKVTDLSFRDAAKLTYALTKGSLPLNFTLNIDAKNPNPSKASLNSMEWIAFIDGIEMVRGNMNQRIEIAANNGVATIPLNVNIDLKKALNKKTKDALLNFGFNLADASDQPTRVSLKIKPTIVVANIPLTYPGYFTVTKEFSSGGR